MRRITVTSPRLKTLVLLTLLGSTRHGILASGGEKSADDVWTSISLDELETRKAPAAAPWIRLDHPGPTPESAVPR